MQIPQLGGYIAPFRNVPNITPFSYRDGATYLMILEELREYINKTVVPFINVNFEELSQGFDAAFNQLLADTQLALSTALVEVDNKISQQNADVSDMVSHLEGLVADSVDLVVATVDNVNITLAAQTAANALAMDELRSDVNDAIEGVDSDERILTVIDDVSSDTRQRLNALYNTTDANVHAIISNATSTTRQLLDALYTEGGGGDPVATDAIVASFVTDVSSATRVALDGLFAPKSVETLTTSGRLSQTSLDAAYAPKSVETLTTSGRLSQTSLNNDYAAKSAQTAIEALTVAQRDADIAGGITAKTSSTYSAITPLIAQRGGLATVRPYDVTTLAALLAGTAVPAPALNDVAFVRNVVGAYFVYNGTNWRMYGTPRFADVAARSGVITTPSNGDEAYTTDTKTLWRFDGAVWIPWDAQPIAFTPANVNLSIGNGTMRATYQRRGRLVDVQYDIIRGTTTSGTGNIFLGLPFNEADWYKDAGRNVEVGSGRYYLAANFSFLFNAMIEASTPGKLRLLNMSPSGSAITLGSLTDAAPKAVAAGERYSARATYEMAF